VEQATGMLFAGGFSLVMYGLFASLGLFFLGVFLFWIWMIIDCAKRSFPPPDSNLKIVWILVIVLAGWVGMVIYFFAVKIPGDRAQKRSLATGSPS